MFKGILDLLLNYWNAAIEILLLAAAIYYGYLYFRGTRGAKVLTGLAILFITLTLVSQILNLTVISWLLRSLTAFLAIALVVIFQPELRRALAELGSSQFFSSATQKKETIDVITEAVFELASRQIGALLAIERDTAIRTFAESGVNIDCDMSQELLITIFFPKTPLHDGGVIIRNDRIIASTGPTPKPPLVTSTRSRSPGRGSRTSAVASKARRTGMPVVRSRSASNPWLAQSRRARAPGTQRTSTPGSAHTACAP